MTFHSVGIFSIGEMGQSVAQVLKANGLSVISPIGTSEAHPLPSGRNSLPKQSRSEIISGSG